MRAARDFYNTTASRYDLRQSNPWTDIVRKKELQLLDKYANGRILDIGCGNGFHLDYLSDKADGKIFGIDVSSGMLEHANKSSCLIGSSAEHLPFPDESFDTALCMFMVLNMCDHAAAIGEIRRVLKPGGKALLSVASIWDNYGKFTKNMRVEKFHLRLNLFEKKDLQRLFDVAELRVLYFDSLFRSPKVKPRWGDFAALTEEQLGLLEKESVLHPEIGAVYFFVLEKSS